MPLIKTSSTKDKLHLTETQKTITTSFIPHYLVVACNLFKLHPLCAESSDPKYLLYMRRVCSVGNSEHCNEETTFMV